MTHPDSVAAGAQKLARAYGQVDILCNDAGVMLLSDVVQLKTSDWHRMST